MQWDLRQRRENERLRFSQRFIRPDFAVLIGQLRQRLDSEHKTDPTAARQGDGLFKGR